jgi:hypothetical protein
MRAVVRPPRAVVRLSRTRGAPADRRLATTGHLDHVN